MHGYVHLEDNRVVNTPWRCRHLWAVFYSVASVGAIVALCELGPASLSPPKLQAQTVGNDQSGVENLASIMQSGLKQPGPTWPATLMLKRPGFLSGAYPGGRHGAVTQASRQEREEAMRAQKEILARRRNKDAEKAYMQEVKDRRSKATKDFYANRIKYVPGKDNLEQWKKLNPEPYRAKDKYTEEPEGFSIPIPLNPIGLPKFDNGERFDLKLPYVDNGYVAEDSEDIFGRFKGLLNFGGKKKPAAPTEAPEVEKKKGWFR